MTWRGLRGVGEEEGEKERESAATAQAVVAGEGGADLIWNYEICHARAKTAADTASK